MKTKNGREIKIVPINWNEAISLIKSINPEMVDVMKQVNFSGEEYTFYKANYRFGDKIIKNKETFLSLEDGESISVNDPQIPEEIARDLAYDIELENPLGMILNKSCELYDERNDSVKSHSLLGKNYIFGIPKALDPRNTNRSSIINFNLNAGSRSLFMLPKISDRNSYVKLRQILSLNINPPVGVEDHWQTFVKIIQQVKCDWTCEILYFPRKFIDKLRSEEWALLSLYLNKMHSSYYNAWHGMVNLWNQQQELISQNKQMVKYNPNLINVVKYIVMLCANSELGCAPAVDDEQAPITLIKDIYRDFYGLENPIVMTPAQFNFRDEAAKPVYLSLHHPGLVYDSITLSGKKTNMAALIDLVYLINLFRVNVLNDEPLNNNILLELVNATKISYYHNATTTESLEIKNIAEILETDDRFCADGKQLPTSAAFFNGCIKIERLQS